ncbi:MAG TPA: hypothetical protein DD706_02250 [Nitrospiraceae bacterium]|nr:hypothetical protein [Nitrospiraceae bacterium]
MRAMRSPASILLVNFKLDSRYIPILYQNKLRRYDRSPPPLYCLSKSGNNGLSIQERHHQGKSHKTIMALAARSLGYSTSFRHEEMSGGLQKEFSRGLHKLL